MMSEVPRPRTDTDTDPADDLVVHRVLSGHHEDFSILVRRYQERFHRFALGMVDDPDAATDAVQDSFVSIYSKLESCREPARFESWAYQILRNRCRDYLKNVRRGHETIEDGATLASSIGRPDFDLEQSELRGNLRRALSSLPDEHREAFLLKHLDGRTYEEISELVDASTSAVKMRVHRSREMLREALMELAPDDDVTFV